VKKRAGFSILSGLAIVVAIIVGAIAGGDHSSQATTDAGPEPHPRGVTTPGETPSAQASVIASAPAAPGSALALLDALPVKAAQSTVKYERTKDFGSAWLDMDDNGCDTRNDVLARDLAGITRNSYCEVLTGTLADPYTGETIAFQRGEKTSALVQIDHVVPLGDAWQTGAQALTLERREQLANDDGNLFAVDQHSNESKGDKDAAAWLPAAAGFRCRYVATQVSIKAAYGLWVTPVEKAAMAGVLNGCPAQPATAAEFPR
jgi:hypothetical protein